MDLDDDMLRAKYNVHSSKMGKGSKEAMMTPKEKRSHARKEKIKRKVKDWAKGMAKNTRKPKFGGVAHDKPITRRLKKIFG